MFANRRDLGRHLDLLPSLEDPVKTTDRRKPDTRRPEPASEPNIVVWLNTEVPAPRPLPPPDPKELPEPLQGMYYSG